MRDPGQHDTLTELFGEFSDRLRGDRWQPAADVFETAVAIVVRLEIAGLRTEDLRVAVDGNLLRIAGVRRVPVGDTVERQHQMEIAFGPFERDLRIHVPFDRDGVSARLEDGFLCVTLPKKVGGSRQVEIETK